MIFETTHFERGVALYLSQYKENQFLKLYILTTIYERNTSQNKQAKKK